MVRKMNNLAKRLAANSKRQRQPEPESDSDGSDFDFDNAIVEEKAMGKPLDEMEVDEDSDGDEEKELQAAFAAGLLKDGLNIQVAKKRPIINKSAEMKEKLAEMTKDLPWVETLEVVTPHVEMDKKVENDDFQRELNFYKQAEKAVQIAYPRLLNLNIKVLRPTDYYAEMAKTDLHMQKVRKRLVDIQEMKERQEAFRRIREEKKFAVKVQKEAIANKNSEKKKLADAVKKHKKGMKQQLEDMLNNVKRHGLDQDDDERPSGGRGGRGGAGAGRGGSMRNAGELKRKLKSDKFGYGGKKKGMKRNNKESFNDLFGAPRGGFGGRGRGGGRGGRGGRGRR
ncbi:unnamed protein product [Caenorhabditis sp. 36 PRJEB53466]|nr:unnamed protein product [Caenorhabditis sp. 36 PRJEB53466]